MSNAEFVIEREKLQVVMTRVFDAPRTRLFEAYTDPEQIPKWWGPAYYTTVVDKMEVRVGGVWRFLQKGEDGKEHAFNGIYKEIIEPERIVYTFEYEPMAGHVLTDTILFEEISDGKTKVTATSQFDNIGDLEGMVAMDMESGAVESQVRLAKLVEQV